MDNGVANPLLVQRGIDRFRRRALLELGGDDRAAFEVHAKVESLRAVRMHGLPEDGRTKAQQHQGHRNNNKEAAISQPVNLNVFEKLKHDDLVNGEW